MSKLYVKCDGCDGCKRYMLEDSREENDFCNGTGFRTADGKSVKQIRLEKEVKERALFQDAYDVMSRRGLAEQER